MKVHECVFEADPSKAADLICAHLDKKREALKLRPMLHDTQPANVLATA